MVILKLSLVVMITRCTPLITMARLLQAGRAARGRLSSRHPPLAMLMGMGQDEIVIGSDDGYVYAWDMDGTAVADWPINQGSSVKATPAVIELDQDASAEVVIGNTNGEFVILGGGYKIYLPLINR